MHSPPATFRRWRLSFLLDHRKHRAANKSLGQNLIIEVVVPLGARLAHGEVRAIGVMEDQRTDAGLRVHHEALRELNTNFLRS